MGMRTVTFELPEESLTFIDQIAENLGADRGTALREAVELYLADCRQLEAESDEAERQIDASNFLTQDEMEARFESRFQSSKQAA